MFAWERNRLRNAAVRYATNGWPVRPGAFLVNRPAWWPTRRAGPTESRRFDCGEPGCPTVACHPTALPASTSVDVVARHWHAHPYTVLFPTGHAFDVLEVPATLGRTALLGDDFVAARGPIAVAPGERWMFLVRPGHGVLPELARHPGVVLHGPDSWVAAPPSPQLGGRVRWELAPDLHGWQPAEPYAVQALMLDAIGAGQWTRAGLRPTWRAAA